MINDRLVYRHRLWVRLTHWINVVCMTVLLMSGLQIFNAHPALYWGNTSHFDNPLLVIRAFPAWIGCRASSGWPWGAAAFVFRLALRDQ